MGPVSYTVEDFEESLDSSGLRIVWYPCQWGAQDISRQ